MRINNGRYDAHASNLVLPYFLSNHDKPISLSFSLICLIHRLRVLETACYFLLLQLALQLLFSTFVSSILQKSLCTDGANHFKYIYIEQRSNIKSIRISALHSLKHLGPFGRGCLWKLPQGVCFEQKMVETRAPAQEIWFELIVWLNQPDTYCFHNVHLYGAYLIDWLVDWLIDWLTDWLYQTTSQILLYGSKIRCRSVTTSSNFRAEVFEQYCSRFRNKLIGNYSTDSINIISSCISQIRDHHCVLFKSEWSYLDMYGYIVHAPKTEDIILYHLVQPHFYLVGFQKADLDRNK